MDPSSLLIGVVVFALSVYLELSNRKLISCDSTSQIDKRYLEGRWRRRRLVHLLLGLMGLLMLAAGLVGLGKAFILLWAAVPLVIFVVVVLAFTDAIQTQRYHRDKLPEIQKASFAGSHGTANASQDEQSAEM